eukprot:281423_1
MSFMIGQELNGRRLQMHQNNSNQLHHAIQLAKEVDPKAVRTLGVVTQIDLMDGLYGSLGPLCSGNAQGGWTQGKPLQIQLVSGQYNGGGGMGMGRYGQQQGYNYNNNNNNIMA